MSIFQEVDPTETSAEAEPAAPRWRQHLARAIRDPDALLRELGLDALADDASSAARQFPLVVPRSFVARMRPGDTDDPLLRQVLPIGAETRDVPGFVHDPVGDLPAAERPGLLHKYEGRALVVAAAACAVHCRYCFRRHFPYADAPLGRDAIDATCAHLAGDDSIREVLLSGGDPLLLSDAVLAYWIDRLASIPHVRRLRLHTRLPIVLPSRIEDGFLGLLHRARKLGLTPWMVVHANHPAELVDDCADALGRLVDAGVPVLNQAVLLRGVNDDEDTLVALCERLTDLRVQSYYLHQLDPVAGAAHFHVPEARGTDLLSALRRRLPGYAVPRYVREDPGAPHKTVLA